jgi:Helix-turn-helix domain
MTLLAYRFALDPTPAQARALRSNAGAARVAFNWGLARVKANLGQREARNPDRDRPSASRDCGMSAYKRSAATATRLTAGIVAAVVVWPRALAFANRAEPPPVWALEQLTAMASKGDVPGAGAAAATLRPTEWPSNGYATPS